MHGIDPVADLWHDLWLYTYIGILVEVHIMHSWPLKSQRPTQWFCVQWLQIKETDDEKTKSRKRKLLKSMKSKMRFQNMDMAQKSKQDSWQSFLQGKGSKKKAGFFTSKV
jgi:hypothetical protein